MKIVNFSAKVRDAKHVNYRLQVKLIEATSGEHLNIIKTVLMEIDSSEEGVCLSVLNEFTTVSLIHTHLEFVGLRCLSGLFENTKT